VPRRLATTAAADERAFEPIRGKKKSGKRAQGKGGGRRGARAMAEQRRRDERLRVAAERRGLEQLNADTGFAFPGEAA
jgi:hypothetical protein